MGIAVLGPLRLDEAVMGRRDRIVLSVLAVHPGETISPERLADAIWPDELPSSWSKIVQGCVVRLRKQLGPGAVETSDQGYRLALSVDEIDAQRFERLTSRARQLLEDGEPDRAAAVAGDALRLWRGDPWPDLEHWDPARVDAARLVDLHLAAQELQGEAILASGHPDQVIPGARTLVAEAPLRERRWLLLARAQYQGGRQSEALATLRQVRAVLARELGIDPGPELVDLETAILRQDPSLAASPTRHEPSATCPYRGLAAYDLEDADIFFGRDSEVQACLRRLTSAPLLVVAGPSGCGKSSLVRAGIAAALRRSGRAVVAITPGARPAALLAGTSLARGTVLVVDQAEELVTMASPSERTAFLQALVTRSAVAPVVVAVRTDHLSALAALPDLARLMEQGLYLLGTMDETALREAVEGPARAAGLSLEPGLVDLLLSEVGHHPGALPLLSHALQETWSRREGGTLTVDGYRASGGIQGAIAQTAEHVYQRAGDERADVVRSLMLRLVAAGPDGDATRVRVPRRLVDDDPRTRGVVDLLVSSRLVTADDGVLAVAHEALARAWPRLRGWLDDDVEGQRTLHHLAPAAEAWESMGRPDSELYRGERLSRVLAWRTASGTELTRVERAFLDRGQRLAQAEERSAWEQARRQRRVNRRLRVLLACTVALLLAASAAGGIALRQSRIAHAAAERQRTSARVADARRLGARALTTSDVSESLLLAVAGVRLDDSPETRSDLAAALQKRALLARSFTGSHGTTTAMDTSPDGGSLAIGVEQGQVWLDDTATGRAVAHYDVTSDHADLHGSTPVFDPDGTRLAVGLGFDDPVPLRLLDPKTLRPLSRQPRLGPAAGGSVEQVSFSPGGDHLGAVVRAPDGSAFFALVWDLHRLGAAPRRVDLDPVDQGLALGTRGERLYTQQPLTAYDVHTGRQLWRRPVKGYLALALDSAGTTLAMERWDDKKNNHVLLVDPRDGHIRRTLLGQTEQVLAVRFSGDGRLLASSAFDGSIVVWDTRSGVIRDRMTSASHLGALALSPDADTLYSAGGTEPVRVWDLVGTHRFLGLRSRSGALPQYSSSMWPTSDASRFAYWWGNDDGTFVRFVDAASGRATPDRDTHQDGSFAAGRWSPDSLRWATGDGHGSLLVFDTSTGRRVAARRLLTGVVTEVAYSADGRSLVAIDDHARLRIADATTLSPRGPAVDLGHWGCCLSAARSGGLVIGFSTATGTDGVQGDAHAWSVVDTATGRVVRSGRVPVSVNASDWSADGHSVAVVGTDGRLRTIDVRSGQVRVSSEVGHNATTYWVRYSEDGHRVVTAAEDGTVSLWEAQSLRLLGSVTTPQPVYAAAGFTADGKVVIGSLDGGIYAWDPSLPHSVAFACQAAGRRLTRLEARAAFGDGKFHQPCAS